LEHLQLPTRTATTISRRKRNGLTRPVHSGRPAMPASPAIPDSGQPSDQSHLPAFLLRPVPAKTS